MGRNGPLASSNSHRLFPDRAERARLPIDLPASYLQAADIVYQQVEERAQPITRTRPDGLLTVGEVIRQGRTWDLLLPMLYLYRHATELALKASIRACADWLKEVEHRSVFEPHERHTTLERRLTHTHDLAKLWTLLRDHLQEIPEAGKETARDLEAALENYRPREDLRFIENFIAQLSEVDTGEAFRYARPRDALPGDPSWYETKEVEFHAFRDSARAVVESLRWMRWLEPPRHPIGVEVTLADMDEGGSSWLDQWVEERDAELYVSEAPDGSSRYGLIGPLAALWDWQRELEEHGVSIASAAVIGAYAPGDPRQEGIDVEARRRGVALTCRSSGQRLRAGRPRCLPRRSRPTALTPPPPSTGSRCRRGDRPGRGQPRGSRWASARPSSTPDPPASGLALGPWSLSIPGSSLRPPVEA